MPEFVISIHNAKQGFDTVTLQKVYISILLQFTTREINMVNQGNRKEKKLNLPWPSGQTQVSARSFIKLVHQNIRTTLELRKN